MDIPECYDPAYQAERITAQQDRMEARLRHCSCCDHEIRTGDHFWLLICRKEMLTVCKDCRQEMEDSEEIEEEETWLG